MKSPGILKIMLGIALAGVFLSNSLPAYSDSRHGRGSSFKGHFSHRGGGHYRGHYGGSDFRVVIGSPFWDPWYSPFYYPRYYPYYSPPFYPYAPATVPSLPQEYIQRTEPAEPAASTPSGVWYFCPESGAYYPYVKECPDDWQEVPAQPPSEIRMR